MRTHYILLGMLAAQVGRLDAAVELIRRAIAICSTNAFYYGNLGSALAGKGQLDEAIAAYRQAIRLKPDLAERATIWERLEGQRAT